MGAAEWPVCSAEVQKRATRVLISRSDAIIQSATGSGKTLSFVMPLLGSALKLPPDANPAEFPVSMAVTAMFATRQQASRDRDRHDVQSCYAAS